MRKEDEQAAQECLYAIGHILEYVEDVRSLDDLISDSRTYDAVMMNFILIGESCSRMSDDLKDKLPKIDWRAIKGFRNFLAHDYFGVDKNILWAAIQFNLPELKVELQKMVMD